MGSRKHCVKTWAEYFEAQWDGRKTFEVRHDDRSYAVGDWLQSEEFLPDTNEFTGRGILFEITYKMHGGKFGLAENMCVLAVRELSRTEKISVGWHDYQTGKARRALEEG